MHKLISFENFFKKFYNSDKIKADGQHRLINKHIG